MKNTLYKLFIFSSILTTVGFIADSDVKETSLILRFVEFSAMLVVVFGLISMLYFTSRYVFSKMKTFRV